CGSSWQIHRRSHRRTTTSSRRRSRAPASTSTSSPRGSASATSRHRRGMHGASSSTPSRRDSSGARARACRSRPRSIRSGSRACAPRARTCCTCSGSCRSSTVCSSVRTCRRSSRRTTSCRAALAEVGVDGRLIPHPVFRSDPPRTDDGRTVLAFGVIRPYKGLRDAIAAVRAAGARLLVAGDPLEPMQPYVDAAHGLEVDWRRGYLANGDVERTLGDATVAIFPYRPELDQSGALLQALGAGVPAVAYDVGGIGDPVRAFGAGRVVPAGDVEALGDAVRELLEDPDALARARAGAERAREELTWDESARAHLELHRELT